MDKTEILKAVNDTRKMEFQARIDDLNALQDVFGDQVRTIVRAERGKKVKANWEAIRGEFGRNDIQGLKETLWKWVQDIGFEFTCEDTSEGTQFIVSKCPIAEMAKELKATDWGYICFCADDPHIVEGFNPNMGFKRTKTLMEGDDCCNHFYYYKSK